MFKRFVSIFFTLIGIFLVYNLVTNSYDEKIIVSNTYNKLNSLYLDKKNKIPKENINNKELNEILLNVDKINYQETKESIKQDVENIKKFNKCQNEINNYVNLDPTTSKYDLTKLKHSINKLPTQQKEYLNKKMNNILNQYNEFVKYDEHIRSLFLDYDKKIVKNDISNDEMKQIKQIKNEKYLEIKKNDIAILNEFLERKNAVSTVKVLNENDNYFELNVPFVSQVDNNILNGCEIASLLMGLNYKGLELDKTLADLALEIPKSDNPHKGFVNSIYNLEPVSVPHWIAPDALANFGSKYGNVVDISGSDINDIKRYIDNDSPVIIYATYGFLTPYNWYGEVPNNLHVMVVIGYNKVTGSIVINDPWEGRIVVPEQKFLSVYNILKYAVAVK